MTKWVSKEKRVEDIVNAAVEIFLEKGYEGASMDAIAQRAQISKGGLYHHFTGKDELLFYANEKLSEPVYLFIQDALSNSDVAQGIKTYIRSYIEHWMNHQKELTFFFLTMTKALTCVDMWPIFEDYFNKMEGLMIGLFEKGIREGSFIEHNAKSGAITLLSALDGISIYLIMNKSLNSDEIIRHFEEKFVTPLIRKK
jgi:AcrR family transcriptional regulator